MPLPETAATRILDTLAEAVTVHDERGKTVYANEAAARLLGFESVEDVVAHEPGEVAARFIITREDGTPVPVEELPGRRLVNGEEAPELLTRSIVRETGQELWLLTKATLVRDGDRAFAVNVIEDLTVARRFEMRQRFLLRAAEALSTSLDYEETLQRVAQMAVPWLADWCVVHLPDPKAGVRQVALAHADPEQIRWARELGERYPPDPDAQQGLPVVLATGKSELYPDIPEELLLRGAQDEEHLRILRQVGMRSVMIVPLTAADRVVGAISFVSAESRRAYDEDDLRFAEDLGARAGVAVENARLYTERTEVARTLQGSLLPERLPPTPGWEVLASYAAGEVGTEVGGDFYDVFPAGEGLMVMLGDVTGKGVAAAALTATARHTARTGALFDPQPTAVLGLVNRVLRDRPQMSPVTLVCAALREADGGAEMTVASAGHPLPLVRRAGGGVEAVGLSDVLLGVVDGEHWRTQTVRLERGDAVLFYTDGLTDTPGADGRFGEARVRAALETAPPEPEAMLRALESAVSSFQAGDVSDDRAMLALSYLGSSDSG